MASRASRASPARRNRSAIPWRTVALVFLGVTLLVVGSITLLSVLLPGGRVGGPLRELATLLLGRAAPLWPLWLIACGAWFLVARIRADALPIGTRGLGALGATLGLLGLLHLFLGAGADLGSGGGFVGFVVGTGTADLLGLSGATAVLLLALLGGLLVALDVGPVQVGALAVMGALLLGRTTRGAYRRLRPARVRVTSVQPRRTFRLRLPRLAAAPPIAETAPSTPLAETASSTSPAPPARPGAWKLPPTGLFQSAPPGEVTPADVRQRARVIEETLASFAIEARVVEVNQGPAVTQFGVEPAPGVAVNRILARSNDLALRLGATPIRMEAPVPGKRVVGLEVPNASVTAVNIRGLLESPEFERIKSRLRLALGRDVTGNPVCADLARMPHLLIAGATGSGKSVCINSIIASLLVQCSPDELQFVMVDPKMVELAPFTGIPHLRMPVVTEMDRVVGALKWVVKEMERRYAACAARRVRNLDAFNKALQPGEPPMPFLVVVIDELADMMMTAADEVEKTLCRLAQLGRAAGIHLVVATQRPSVDVITGLIKANFPTRISFAVSSQVDSRTILDMAGAEKLLGRGDMLFLATDASKPRRLQGAYVSDHEILQLVGFWTRLGAPGYTDDEVREVEALGRGEADSESDELYRRALDLAGQYQRLSTSLLQRRLGIGYPRAARLMDLLVERSVVAPSEDGKSREVLGERE